MMPLQTNVTGIRTADPFRVLHFSTWGEVCGIAEYANELIGGMAVPGVRHDVFPVDKRVSKYFLPGRRRAWLNEFVATAAGYDLVHVQHEESFFNGTVLDDSYANFFHVVEGLRGAGKPLVVTFHTEPPEPPRPPAIRTRWKAKLLRRPLPPAWPAPRLFGPDATNVRALVHAKKSLPAFVRFGFSEHLLHTIPMGVKSRPAAATVSRAKARATLGLPDDAVLMTLFGFVSAYKGPTVAATALRHLPGRFRLALVGGPHPNGAADDTFERVLALADGLDPGRLTVTGFASDETVGLYHAAADLCLAPYRDNNMISSAAITEALASGRPVVTSDIASFRELNETADCLELAAPDCPRELAWRVTRLLADRPRQDRLVANARAYVAKCSFDRVGHDVLRHYSELSGRPLARPALAVAA